MQPLTEQEKQFAEKNHGLVYSFLHRYKYKDDDFYDIVIFGFLKAVQVYHRKADVKRKYDFEFIAWQYMRSETGNHFRMESALKRKMETATIGLDKQDIEDVYNLENRFIERETFLEYVRRLDDEQRKIIEWRIRGYNNMETCSGLQMKKSTYYKIWNRVKKEMEKDYKIRI